MDSRYLIVSLVVKLVLSLVSFVYTCVFTPPIANNAQVRESPSSVEQEY